MNKVCEACEQGVHDHCACLMGEYDCECKECYPEEKNGLWQLQGESNLDYARRLCKEIDELS